MEDEEEPPGFLRRNLDALYESLRELDAEVDKIGVVHLVRGTIDRIRQELRRLHRYVRLAAFEDWVDNATQGSSAWGVLIIGIRLTTALVIAVPSAPYTTRAVKRLLNVAEVFGQHLGVPSSALRQSKRYLGDIVTVTVLMSILAYNIEERLIKRMGAESQAMQQVKDQLNAVRRKFMSVVEKANSIIYNLGDRIKGKNTTEAGMLQSAQDLASNLHQLSVNLVSQHAPESIRALAATIENQMKNQNMLAHARTELMRVLGEIQALGPASLSASGHALAARINAAVQSSGMTPYMPKMIGL